MQSITGIEKLRLRILPKRLCAPKEKLLKKILAVAAAALICGSLALAACGENAKPKGEISGNYTEITAAELDAKLQTLDANGLFADSSAEDWQFGTEITGNAEFSAHTQTFGNAPFIDGEINISGKTQVKLTRPQSGTDGFAVKARSNLKIQGGIKKSEALGIDKDIAADYDINAFADGANLYFQLPDMSNISSDFPAAGKYMLPLKYLIEGIIGLLPPTVAKMQLPDVQKIVNSFKLKAYADDSNGLKLKVSADKESFYAAMQNFPGMTAERAENAASFDKFAVDLYFETDSDGGFMRAGLIIDIDGNLSLKGGEFGNDSPRANGPVKLKADLSARKFNGEIVIPTSEELKEYKSLLPPENEEKG